MGAAAAGESGPLRNVVLDVVSLLCGRWDGCLGLAHHPREGTGNGKPWVRPGPWGLGWNSSSWRQEVGHGLAGVPGSQTAFPGVTQALLHLNSPLPAPGRLSVRPPGSLSSCGSWPEPSGPRLCLGVTHSLGVRGRGTGWVRPIPVSRPSSLLWGTPGSPPEGLSSSQGPAGRGERRRLRNSLPRP